jgi:hypothetical protein
MAKTSNAISLSVLAAAALLVCCNQKQSSERPADPDYWIITSYDEDVLTLKYKHVTYKAKCEGHRSITPNQTYIDVAPSYPCWTAIDAVGLNIEQITAKTPLPSPQFAMTRASGTWLMLRKDDIVEIFGITAAKSERP